MEEQLLKYYFTLRRQTVSDFDMAEFRADYACLGAQRNTKILGIFARLAQRDHKPTYLRHLPRVAGYLARNLAHPALADLKTWYDAHFPQGLGKGGHPT